MIIREQYDTEYEIDDELEIPRRHLVNEVNHAYRHNIYIHS